MTVTTGAFAVRRARASDMEHVLRLWLAGARRHLGLAGYAEELPEPQLRAEGLAWARDYLYGRHTAVFLAFAPDGKAIGMASASVSSRSILHRDARIVTVGDAYTDPEWRRHGVLRAVVGAVEQWARDVRAVATIADYAADNEEAAAAWRALGYEPEAVRVRRPLYGNR